MVHDPVATDRQSLRVRSRIRRAAVTAVLLLCIAALTAGCGSSRSSEATAARASGASAGVDVGESARSDTCAQWRAGTDAQRAGALSRLRKFAGSPVGSSTLMKNGHVLNEKQAYKLFQDVCKRHFARAFKLYKLYERAAAFIGHAEQ
ncbi:MAG: hypothetical protein QOK19_2826 [Solirubrobacteraceae bacterium]|nr:hypothetical protein [Solirubrobacteraceae bacterium]